MEKKNTVPESPNEQQVAESVIEARGITKVYGEGEVAVRALDDVSLTVKRGEFVAVTGHSGSGKTTLMSILGCLDIPDAGEYFLDGEDVISADSDQLAKIRNEKIGFVFQRFNLLQDMNALENVMLPAMYAERDLREAEKRARELLEMVGLGDRIKHRPNELSGGQQQRVAIARALINSPSILMADEPTGNLDSSSGARVLEIFQRLNEKEGVTLLVVTHEDDVANLAERRIVMRDGRIVSDDAGVGK